MQEISGIPFIGENGYYPRWARGSGRWVFQRTLIVIGQMLGDIARLHAMEVAVSDQIIVWSPPTRFPIFGSLPSAVHRERQRALKELEPLRLVCYSEKCRAPKPGIGTDSLGESSAIRELGVQPDKWLLVCPLCGASAGPDVACMKGEPLIRRWKSVGAPVLANPGCGAGLKSVG